VDSSSATVTLVIVAPVINGASTDDTNTPVAPVEDDTESVCSDYETSIPSLSIFSIFLMFVLSMLIVKISFRKEI